MSAKTGRLRKMRRRGVVVVQIAVLLVVILGFAALAVDMGMMYNTKAELQHTADAAALGAALMLSEYDEGDPLVLARDAAGTLALSNQVLGKSVLLDSFSDVVFGKAVMNEDTGSYTFNPTEAFPDAVQVTVRKTADSENGAVSLFFARALGIETAELRATSTAMMVPRDIAIVADLSASHNDDCEFIHFKITDICMYDVWDTLPGGLTDDPSTWDGDEFSSDPSQTAGPGWGHMREFGFGTNPITTSYNPTSDPGLVYLPRYSSWSNATISSALYAQGYITAEVDAMLSSANDGTSSYYNNRVAVALGLAQWNSGIAGGLWSKTGQPAGNNNTIVGTTEMTWLVPVLSQTVSASSSIWSGYITYVRSSSTSMAQADTNFRYRYGIKTMMNFMLDDRERNSQTPEFSNVPAQPMQAVKDAVVQLADTLYELDTDDLLSLEIYGQTPYHEVDLTANYHEVSDRLNEMSAGYYDGWTNMGGGMATGIAELTGPRARPTSLKTMILLTDGKANVNESGGTNDEEGGIAYAMEQAQLAADAGIRIFAVSVGADAYADTMAEIAAIGGGEHFHAGDDMDEYADELSKIFESLGGTRPVELIK